MKGRNDVKHKCYNDYCNMCHKVVLIAKVVERPNCSKCGQPLKRVIKVSEYIKRNFKGNIVVHILNAINQANDEVSGDYVLNFYIDENMTKYDFIRGMFKHHLTVEGQQFWHKYAVSLKQEKPNG